MTSINEVQKLNKLAKSLVNHNAFGGREEAVEKAREMMKNPVFGEVKPQVTNKETQSQKSDDEGMEGMKRAMQKNVEFISKTIFAFQKDLDGIKAELADLKREMKQMKLGSTPRQPTTQQTVQQTSEIKQVTKETSHPRSGNTNASDVSIEKMFYYGK